MLALILLSGIIFQKGMVLVAKILGKKRSKNSYLASDVHSYSYVRSKACL